MGIGPCAKAFGQFLQRLVDLAGRQCGVIGISEMLDDFRQRMMIMARAFLRDAAIGSSYPVQR